MAVIAVPIPRPPPGPARGTAQELDSIRGLRTTSRTTETHSAERGSRYNYLKLTARINRKYNGVDLIIGTIAEFMIAQINDLLN